MKVTNIHQCIIGDAINYVVFLSKHSFLYYITLIVDKMAV